MNNMLSKKRISVGVLGFLALAAVAIACSSSGDGGDGPSCDTFCSTTLPTCGETSCLAECIQARTACAAASHPEAFADLAGCNPTLTCELSGGYALPTTDACQVPIVEVLTRCGSGMSATFTPPGGGMDSGIVIPMLDASHPHDTGIVFLDGTTGHDATGDDSGFDDSGSDSGCGICTSDCTNACDETCTGGDCVSEDAGCGVCESDCLNGCDESCTGGDCCTPDGTCGSDCEDNCGNACTGGDCEQEDAGCVSTGCTSCDTLCGEGDSCDDNCGNPCC
jgi:hypothetical protein